MCCEYKSIHMYVKNRENLKKNQGHQNQGYPQIVSNSVLASMAIAISAGKLSITESMIRRNRRLIIVYLFQVGSTIRVMLGSLSY